MKRPTAIVFLVLASALVGGVWVGRSKRADGAPASATASPAATAKRAEAEPAPTGGAALEANVPANDDAVDIDDNADAGLRLADGGAVPDLEGAAPKSVVFGVVLVQYAGAQGAPTGARTRAEAQTLAKELAALAKSDFKAAVERGDPGSTVNAGRMFRGVLESAPEYALFSLAKGDVSEPVDTPRGYWVVHRVE